VLSKTITLQDDGLLIYDGNMNIPSNYESAKVEAPVIYMPGQFSRFRFFDPATGLVYTWPNTLYENLPLITSNKEGFTVGIWSPESRQTVGVFGKSGVNSMRASHNLTPFSSQVYSFRTYLAFGTINMVKATISRAYKDRP
jgi:hypothetical protein